MPAPTYLVVLEQQSARKKFRSRGGQAAHRELAPMTSTFQLHMPTSHDILREELIGTFDRQQSYTTSLPPVINMVANRSEQASLISGPLHGCVWYVALFVHYIYSRQ